jgi:PAS domain-containing protein
MSAMDIQSSQWRSELEQLREEMIRTSADGKDRDDLEEEFQTSLEALACHGLETISQPAIRFRRSIDLIARPYVETDRAGIIRRTNKALLSLLNLEPPRRVIGTPLLLFIARGDRQRFVKEFLSAGRERLYLSRLIVRVQPDYDDAVWMELDGHRIEGPDRQLLSVVWLLSAAKIA